MFLSIAEQAPKAIKPTEYLYLKPSAIATQILLAQRQQLESQPPQEKVVSIGSHTITLLLDTYSYTETVNLLKSAQNGLVNTEFRKMFLTPEGIKRIGELNNFPEEKKIKGRIPESMLSQNDIELINEAIRMNAFAKQFAAQILKHNFSTSPKLIVTAQLNGQSVYAEITKNGNRYTVTFQKGNHESSQQKEDTKQELKSSRVIPLRFEHIPISTYDNSIQEFDSTVQPQGLRLVRSLFDNQILGPDKKNIETANVETAILQVQKDIVLRLRDLKDPGEKHTYIIDGKNDTRGAITIEYLGDNKYELYLTPLDKLNSNLQNQLFAERAVTQLLRPRDAQSNNQIS